MPTFGLEMVIIIIIISYADASCEKICGPTT